MGLIMPRLSLVLTSWSALLRRDTNNVGFMQSCSNVRLRLVYYSFERVLLALGLNGKGFFNTINI